MVKIVAYLKPTCGWSNGVRAIMDKYGLEYDSLVLNSLILATILYKVL